MLQTERGEDCVAAVRRFNRFYTQRIGVLREGLSGSRFSLAEARILYELAQRDFSTASDLARDLGIDAGYLSRIMGGLQRQGLVDRTPAGTDRRRRHLTLTAEGRRAFASLEQGARAEISALLAPLGAPARQRLVAAMREIERELDPATSVTAMSRPAAPSPPPVVLRRPLPGDLGWVISRHGAIYAAEYGFDARFEALVAGVAAAFGKGFDPRREGCWIAEQGGTPVGSVFLVRDSDVAAKLRLLLVEPTARGHGVGRRLVTECVGFAGAAGYRTVTLWTQSILLAARKLYRDAGFRLARSEPHHSFGCDLVGEYWELTL